MVSRTLCQLNILKSRILSTAFKSLEPSVSLEVSKNPQVSRTLKSLEQTGILSTTPNSLNSCSVEFPLQYTEFLELLYTGAVSVYLAHSKHVDVHCTLRHASIFIAGRLSNLSRPN